MSFRLAAFRPQATESEKGDYCCWDFFTGQVPVVAQQEPEFLQDFFMTGHWDFGQAHPAKASEATHRTERRMDFILSRP